MDDYNINTLIESKNEWAARLTNILTPCIIEGINSIFTEAYSICIENEEDTKYLMTFQNLLNNVPNWSSQVIETEKTRIETSSGCNYLEDLITCVHIIQLKSLTSARVGLKQRKIDIDIPNINIFLHKVYINVARKIYVNVYLFEKDIPPLNIQKNNRELEIIIKECILNTIRDNIPTEKILRCYLDETVETDVEIEEKKELIPDKELIQKNEEKKKEEELNKIKQEIKEKVENENKLTVSTAIKNANKSLNISETENPENTKDKDSDDLQILDNIDNDLSLDIKEISDPDKLNNELDELNLNDFNDDFDLEITELK